mmetsp:Transcript_45486/g.120126  ORF Transcript_45486/g.120126 Transcript_45486/m.120126 type:complete len:211 (-) Transcript_45486:50-682(-)
MHELFHLQKHGVHHLNFHDHAEVYPVHDASVELPQHLDVSIAPDHLSFGPVRILDSPHLQGRLSGLKLLQLLQDPYHLLSTVATHAPSHYISQHPTSRPCLHTVTRVHIGQMWGVLGQLLPHSTGGLYWTSSKSPAKKGHHKRHKMGIDHASIRMQECTPDSPPEFKVARKQPLLLLGLQKTAESRPRMKPDLPPDFQRTQHRLRIPADG